MRLAMRMVFGYLRVGLLLAATCIGPIARANGDHPLRLPPPDPGPALARIAAEAEARAHLPAPPVMPLAPVDVPREPGQAIFPPFSSGSLQPAARAVTDFESGEQDSTFTTAGLFVLLAAAGLLWRWVRRA